MKVAIEVDIPDVIVEKMGLEKVKKLLAAYADDPGIEFLKEDHEGETGEWIVT